MYENFLMRSYFKDKKHINSRKKLNNRDMKKPLNNDKEYFLKFILKSI